jgi:heat shock protein HspQ
VIFDVDATFGLSDQWYETVARSRPPRDKPWYHLLVDGASHTTYVAERHLEADESNVPVDHPLLKGIFSGFENGRYILDVTEI